MGKQKTAPTPNENLTISRIHIVLRPFETKLNVLAKTLERKIAEDKYAPKARQPGITYAKRHRIRAMTGMTSRQAGRAYALEKSKGLSTLYSFHEQLIGVEDAFRNLVRGTPGSQGSNDGARPRVPSLQAMVCQMIGRQVAEETLRDKEELEAEGVEDCIGLWYGGLSVHCRKYALVAHAVQLVELKIPFFILELWKGLLMITMQTGLHEEAYILLEYILLYYFTPSDSTTADCPAAQMNGRDLTDLYNQLTSMHSLPPAGFFSILLPIIEASPGAAAIWNFRCIQHLIRNMDGDIVLTARIVESMTRTFALTQADRQHEPSLSVAGEKAQNPVTDVERLGILVESKVYFVLALVTGAEEDVTGEIVLEVGHLAWTTHHIGKLYNNALLEGISLALDTIILLRILQRSSNIPHIDISDAVERLGGVGPFTDEEGEREIYITLIKALYTANPAAFSATSASSLDSCVAALRRRELLALADGIERCHDGMVEREDHMRLRLVPPPLVSEKRSRGSKESGRVGARKRRKGNDDSEGGDSAASDSNSEVATEWSASVSGEDTAGEQEVKDGEDRDEEGSTDGDEDDQQRQSASGTDDEVDEPVTLESRSINEADEEGEELEEELDPDPIPPTYRPTRHQLLVASNRYLPSHRPSTSTSTSRNLVVHQPAPVLQSVVSARMSSALVARLARRTRELERDRMRVGQATSSDDDLDLLGREAREEAEEAEAVGARSSRPSGTRRRELKGAIEPRERWSTP